METKDLVKLGIGVLLFLAWILLVVLHVQGAEDIITAIKVALAGLGAYHLNDRTNLPPPSGPTAPTTFIVPPGSSNQQGFASLHMLLLILVLGCCMLLGGCASWVQAASAYNQSAVVSLQASEDLNIKVWSENACGTPLSAIKRNPQVAPALKSLCLGASTGNAGDLLDAVTPKPVQTSAQPAATPAPATSQ